MKRNKILIIVTDLQLGGIQNYVRALAALLSEMHFNVFIIAINDAQNQGSENIISLKKLKSFQKPLYIRRFLKENEIDLILDHRTKSNFIKWKIYDFLFRKTPKVQFIHSANLKLYFYNNKYFNQLMYQNTQLFVSVSKYIEQLVGQKTDTKLEVGYYFFQKNEKLIENTGSLKKDILFVGRFDDAAKDLNFLLHAYLHSELYLQNIRFIFLGAGKDQLLIENFAKENNLENHIKICAPVKDTSPYYHRAKTVVLASRFEGFPLVLLEALYHKTPVITTEFNASVYEIIQSDYNGIVTEKNIPAFSDALKKIYNDAVFYEQLLLNVQTPLSATFSKDNAKLVWEKIISDLLKNRTLETGSNQ